MKNIAILGSTGSIGTQAIDVCNNVGYNICALSAYSNIKLLADQARSLNPKLVCIYKKELYNELSKMLIDTDIKIVCGEDGLLECCAMTEIDIVVNAVVGISGLFPTIESIKNNKTIALANKESIVTGGGIINDMLKKYNSKIIPVDSEHNAIFQCLKGNNISEVNKIILTASGGPFYGKKTADLEHVTLEQALNHPNWSMGKKISVDSATLMNKGLELIEACNLFNIPPEMIEIVVHRQSIIHSMVEYRDNSIIAQLGVSDMRIPIQYALTYPDRLNSTSQKLDLIKLKNLTFDEVDIETFICLKSCIKAAKLGGLYPTLVNGANEAAVELFILGKISFLDIGKLVTKALDIKLDFSEYSLNNIIKADKIAREFVNSNV